MADASTDGWQVDPTNPNRITYTDETGKVYEAIKDAPASVSAGQIFKDSYANAAQNGFPGFVARKAEQVFGGHSADEVNAAQSNLRQQDQHQLADDMKNYESQQQNGPTSVFGHDLPEWMTTPIPGTEHIGGKVANLAGEMLGGAGPEYFVGGVGGNVAKRIGIQALASGAADAFYQAVDKADDLRKDFDVNEMLKSAATGAAFQGVAEVPGFVKDLFKERGIDTNPENTDLSHAQPLSGMRLSPEDEAAYHDLLGHGSAQDILDFFDDKPGLSVKPSDVISFVAARDAQRPVTDKVTYQSNDPVEAKLAAEANQHLEKKSGQTAQAVIPEVIPSKERITAAVDAAVDHINNVTKDWNNAPAIEVHPNLDHMPDVDPDAIGVTTPEGKVLINMKNVTAEAADRGVKPEDILSSVTFHEGLGHHGLTQKFGDDLDSILQNLYHSSDKFQSDVDKWMHENPDAYPDDHDPVARASEEVLAEMSQDGRISPTLLGKFRNWMKSFGRDMGLNLKYSSGEIKTILGMAHDAVVKGGTRDVAANGFRYSRTTIDPNKVAKANQDFNKTDYQEPTMHDSVHPYDLQNTSPQPEGIASGNGMNDRQFARAQKDFWKHKQTEDASVQQKAGPFNEVKREDDGTIHLTYDTGNGKKLPVKMGIEPDGTAEISVDQFGNGKNDLGPAKIRQAMLELAHQYPEIKRFGGYRRSGAGAGRVQEVEIKKAIDGANRYMKRRSIGNGSNGTLQGRSVNEARDTGDSTIIPKFRSNRPIEQLMRDNAPEKMPETWGEWLDQADKIRMTGKRAAGLDAGTQVAELKAAEHFLVKSTNRIFDLSHKIAEGHGTERDKYLLMAEMNRNADIQRAIGGVISNAARILNSRNIEVSTDAALADSIRNMMATNNNKITIQQIEDLAKKIKSAKQKQAVIKKSSNLIASIINLPRALMATYDLSAPFRQGIGLVSYKEFWKAYAQMFKFWGSSRMYEAAMSEIKSRPSYELMKKAKLSLSDIHGSLTDREERFASNIATKIPGVGMSERAYTGFLNKVRADVFDSIVKKAQTAGIDFTKDPKALKDIGSFINNATGRGDIRSLTEAGPLLNGLLFSPRLMASRLQMLNPVYYAKLSPIARREAVRSMIALGALATTVLGLAHAGGADVEYDPRSSDFGKIKVGNTRYDILGGYGQYITLGARISTNQTKNMYGEVSTLGKKFGAPTRLDVAEKFFENKSAPIASLVEDYLRGKDAVGNKFNTKTELVKHITPLIAQDAYDLFKQDGAKGVLMATPGVFGIGVQTYGPNTDRELPDLPSDDPVSKEVVRLEQTAKKSLIGAPASTLIINGEEHELTDKEFNNYQKLSAYYTSEIIREQMKSPDWKSMSDTDKISEVKQIKNFAGKSAREYLFYPPEDNTDTGSN